MNTTDTIGGYTAPPASTRLLRRSRDNRVAAGVCSGLGEYFAVDPVLFRVLFATAAFFGGAGILAYLLAWAAIPDASTEHAPIDSFIAWVRRRRVPMWVAAFAAGLFLWAIAFSWWAPGPFFPVIAVVVLLVVIFTRRETRAAAEETAAAAASLTSASSAPLADAAPAGATTVELTKQGPTAEQGPTTQQTGQPAGQPTWVRDARSWFDEARETARLRRRRSLPIRIAVLASLVVTLTVLGLVDAFHGIEFQVYFWSALGILGLGMLIGFVTRRSSFATAPLLLLSIAGAIAFGGSHASLHDGVGQREWKPTGNESAEYKLMFGQGILDLRDLPTQTGPRTFDITLGAGQVKIIARKSLNMTVLANVHIGQLEIDGRDNSRHGGVGISRTIEPPPGANGAPITVRVHVADGNLTVEHR